MKDDEVKRLLAARPDDEAVLHLPMTAGAVAICHNVPGLPEGKALRLSRRVLIDILLGRITEWNDPALARLNPGSQFPEMDISWVRRSEGSGTTFAFTSHLSALSPEWKKEFGADKSVDWKVGIGAKGNNGVAALIAQTPGTLGYVEYGFADLAGLKMAALENKAGQLVAPSPRNSAEGLLGAKGPDGFRLAASDPPGKDAYPIVTYTWMLARKRYKDADRAAGVRRVLGFCIGEGQEFSEQLGYIKLPDEVRRRVKAATRAIGP